MKYNRQKLVEIIIEVLKEEDVYDKYGHLISTSMPKSKPNRFDMPDEEIVFILHPLISFAKQKYDKKYEMYLEQMLEFINNLKKRNEDINRAVAMLNKQFDSGFSVNQIKKMLEVFRTASNLKDAHNLINFYNQAVERNKIELPSYKPSKDKPREATPVLKERVKIKYKCN